MSKIQKWSVLILLVGICLMLCACTGGTISVEASEWSPTIWNCWPCAIYGSSFEIANDVVFSATKVIVPLTRVILGMGLLFLILFRVLKMTLFMSEKDMVKTFKETGIVLMKAMFVSILIYDGDQLLYLLRDYFIYPIGEFFMLMANAVLDCVPGAGQYFMGVQGLSADSKEIFTSSGFQTIEENKSIFGDLGIQVQYTVSRIFSSLRSGVWLALWQLNNPGIMSWIFGFLAGMQTFSLMVIFPLAFVDGFIMLAFYVIFFPIALVLWVFPKTQGYLKALIPYIFGPFLQLLFGCIIVVLLVTLIQVYSDIGLNGIFRGSTQDANAWVNESVSAGRPPIFIMLMLLIALKKIAGEVGEFSTLFGGGKVDATLFGLMDAARKAVKEAAIAAAEIAIAVATGGTSSAASVTRRLAQEAAKKAQKEMEKKAKEALKKAVSNGDDSGSGEGS